MASPIEGGDLITLVDLDQDLCQETYGTGNCTASLSADNPDKCRNTYATCQDTANYDRGTLTLRFVSEQCNYPIDDGVYTLPTVQSVKTRPSRLNTSSRSRDEPLGTRAKATVVLKDHKHSDRYVDPYAEERISGAAQFSGEGYDPLGRGTFWGRWRARNLHYIGRAMRIRQGVIKDGDLSSLVTRHYIIEKIEGPDTAGTVTITGKDPLKLLDDDRAQYPPASPGRIDNSGGINDTDTSITLEPAGIGNSDYAASGYVSVNKEVMSFTRSGDTLTVTRGQKNTAAASHAQGDTVQQCADLSDDAASLLYTLLVTGAGVNSAYINQAAWDAEAAAYLPYTYERFLARPVAVEKLVKSLCKQTGVSLWWDEITPEIGFSAIKSPGPPALIFTEDNVVAGSIVIKDKPESRVSQVWTNYRYANPFDDDDYGATLVSVDSGAGTNDQYGQDAVRKIEGTWLPGIDAAEDLNNRLLSRFRDMIREVRFALPGYRADEVRMGDNHAVQTRYMQDANGDNALVDIRILAIEQQRDKLMIEAEEVREFATIDPDDLTVRITTNREQGVNLKDLYDSTYSFEPTGTTDITFIVEAGVVVGSDDPAVPAFSDGDISSYSYNSITVIVRGTIAGPGGPGGDAHNRYTGADNNGHDGGVAIYTRTAFDLTIDASGVVQGGGGGGAGGEQFFIRFPYDGGGGGGGAGYPPAPGGRKGDNNSKPGDPGTLTAGGAGGDGAFGTGGAGEQGGDGGGPAQAGQSTDEGTGGAAGDAIDGVSYLTVTNNGTITGSQVN